MSWVTVIFAMTASACLTLGLIHGFIWWQRRDSWANLLFMLTSLGTAAFAWCDLVAAHAESAAQFGSAVRWMQVTAWIVLVPLAGFVHLYLRAGRTWLLWSVCGARTLALILNFSTGQSLNFREVASLRHISFLGESVSIADGVANPWMVVGQLSIWGLMIFVVDAALAVWRRGDRRQALIVGGSIVFFLLVGAVQAVMVVRGILHLPPWSSLAFLGIIVAMAYELGGDTLRATQLARDLRASEQQMSIAAEAANLGFWFWEFARNQIWASDHWRALLGFSQSQRLHLEDLLDRLHPDDREMTRETLTKASQGVGRYQMECRVLLPDGSMRWIASQGRVESTSSDHPQRLQGVSLDISLRKQADLEAQAHRNEVAHLLRVASLGELSSSLAHELKQPLAAILSNAQAVELFLAQDKYDLQEIREIMREIVTEDMRANEVIDRLRALLRKGEVEPVELDANDLIQEVLKLLNQDLTSRAVRVMTELADDLPSIQGDRVQLQQVLINLILNAADAMSQPAFDSRIITLRSSRVEGVVEISVTDIGKGIPPGSEEKIFEPYHTTKPQGLGLGLSLSRSIVSAHGGRLWAENLATGGAQFHCRIPTPRTIGDASSTFVPR
jgi:two-component system sensor kinase FixL